MSRFLLPVLAAILLSTPLVRAGEDLDALRSEIAARIAGLEYLTVETPGALRKVEKALAAFGEGLDLLNAGDEESMRLAFRRIGKGMRLVRKAAKRERGGELEAFSEETDDAIWDACSAIFFERDVSEPPTEEEALLLEELGKKLRGSVRAATREKFSRAVKKLGRAWPTLVLLRPDP